MDLQFKGGQHDSTHSIKFSNSSECDLFFQNVKEVFFQIASWGPLFGGGTAFYRVDKDGNVPTLPLTVGDLVKIRIPGPKNKMGEGYDWVKIIDFEIVDTDNSESFRIILSPTHLPEKSNTAHFFENAAKNYFLIKKYNLKITAEVHGRNEVPNYINLSLRDKIRNFFVANGGIFGFSKIHWKLWTQNILNEKYLNKCKKLITKENYAFKPLV